MPKFLADLAPVALDVKRFAMSSLVAAVSENFVACSGFGVSRYFLGSGVVVEVESDGFGNRVVGFEYCRFEFVIGEVGVVEFVIAYGGRVVGFEAELNTAVDFRNIAGRDTVLRLV